MIIAADHPGLRHGLRLQPDDGDGLRHAAGRRCAATPPRCSPWRATSARRSASRSPRSCWRATSRSSHADLAAGITPFNRVLQATTPRSTCSIRRPRMARRCWTTMINQQAQIIAYNNDFRMMMLGGDPAVAAAAADARRGQQGAQPGIGRPSGAGAGRAMRDARCHLLISIAYLRKSPCSPRLRGKSSFAMNREPLPLRQESLTTEARRTRRGAEEMVGSGSGSSSPERPTPSRPPDSRRSFESDDAPVLSRQHLAGIHQAVRVERRA